MSTTSPTPSGALPVAAGRRTASVLLHTALGHRAQVVRTLVTTALSSAGTVGLPLLLGRAVDVVSAAGPVGGSGRDDRVGRLLVVLALLGVAAVLTAVFTGLARRDAERLGAFVAADLREQVLDRSLRLEPRTLERAGTGDVASRVTEDVELFTSSVQLGATVLTSAVTVALSAVGFATLDWRLALAFCVVFPVYALSLRDYLPRSGPLYARERAVAADRSRVVLESLRGQDTVQAYGMQDLQTARIEAASERTVHASLAALRTYARLSVSMNGAEAVGLAALLLVGFWSVRGDLGATGTTVGDVTAAALLFHRLFGPLGMLLLSFDDVQRAGAALSRLVGVVDTEPPPTRLARALVRPVGLRVRGVRHRYDEDGTGPEVLRGIDLDVPAGGSLAVVGESGAGKTTLAAILGGVFPASAGTVELTAGDGAVAIDALDPEQVRDRIGVVAQETHVFTGTLREDLTLARPDADDAELLAALARVGADGWARSLPAGLGTRVGAGEHPLTAAQEQQLALARVVLRDPPVVVLDEATAEAGSAGARDLERAAVAVLEGRTSVVVAHRLSQARTCDRIAVMAHGGLVEVGTHDELVALGGRYAQLWGAWSSTGRVDA